MLSNDFNNIGTSTQHRNKPYAEFLGHWSDLWSQDFTLHFGTPVAEGTAFNRLQAFSDSFTGAYGSIAWAAFAERSSGDFVHLHGLLAGLEDAPLRDLRARWNRGNGKRSALFRPYDPTKGPGAHHYHTKSALYRDPEWRLSEGFHTSMQKIRRRLDSPAIQGVGS